jgi:hypothetical protein
MAGLIAMRNESAEQRPRSTEHSLSLKEWLALLAETFQKNSTLSDLQIKGYQIALHPLTPTEIHAACEQTLATWTLVAMPPPAVILEAHKTLQSTARVESHRWVNNQPSDEELHRRGLEYCASVKERTLTIADLSKTAVKPEPTPIIATKERLDELEHQKAEVLAKYGG